MCYFLVSSPWKQSTIHFLLDGKKLKTWVNDGIFNFAWTNGLMISCIILWTVGWNLWIDTAMLTHIHTETSVFIWLACGWWHSGWFSHFIGHRGRTGLCLFRASQRDTVSLSTQLPHWSHYQCQTHRERERLTLDKMVIWLLFTEVIADEIIGWIFQKKKKKKKKVNLILVHRHWDM